MEENTKKTQKQTENAIGKENKIVTGVIWQQLLLFFFPILFGTFFQQLYNAADAVIVGRFVGKEALSAVGGGTGTLIQLLVGFFVGLSSGATVIISQYYGAKRAEMVGYAVHTSIAFSLVAGVGMMIVGITAAPWALRAMSTPEDILGPATTYIRIYFLGVIGNLIYNMGAGILRAVGDSKRPLYFLIASCLTNIVLDIAFVIGLHMGVAGAALATILSQALSAVLVLWVLMRTKDMHRLELRKIRFDGRMFRRIIRIGLPAGLQSVMYTSSNILIQSSVNELGTDTVAAWTAYSKIDSLFWMIVNAFGISITTFVGQNLGRGNEPRARQGVRRALAIAMAATVLVMIPVLAFAPQMTAFFNRKPEVVAYGALLLRCISPFYVLCCFNQVYAAALRGAGNSKATMIIMLCSFVLFRQVYLFIMSHYISHELIPLVMGYPAGWLVCSAATLIYYRRTSFLSTRLVAEDGSKEDIQ